MPCCRAPGERPGEREASVPGNTGEIEPLLLLGGDPGTVYCMSWMLGGNWK